MKIPLLSREPDCPPMIAFIQICCLLLNDWLFAQYPDSSSQWQFRSHIKHSAMFCVCVTFSQWLIKQKEGLPGWREKPQNYRGMTNIYEWVVRVAAVVGLRRWVTAVSSLAPSLPLFMLSYAMLAGLTQCFTIDTNTHRQTPVCTQSEPRASVVIFYQGTADCFNY